MTKREEEQLALTMAYKNLFASPNGQMVLNDLKTLCQYSRSSLPANRNTQIDVHRLLVDEAQWSVVNYIVCQIEKDINSERPIQVVSEKENSNV